MTDDYPPRVSVLMPCFNRASTIDEATASIVTQSWHDLELIAVDDGSTDETPAKLEAWAERDRRVRVVRQDHLGLVATLNAGWAACRGEYLARHDADDIAFPERLEAQVQRLEREASLAAV